MCLMGAHQQKFLHQHELQQIADVMYENLFPATKINFPDFHGGLQNMASNGLPKRAVAKPLNMVS